MDEQRWRNVSEGRLAYTAGETHTARSPIQAFLEVSARCNLRCQMCAINYDTRYKNSSRRPPYFTPELFSRLRPIFPSLLRAYLFGLGEPLLNPHLIDYIEELTAAGVDVTFTTNATLIDEEKAEQIARSGVSCVTVSIDGATRETYEAIRVGATFERVMRGIRLLAEAAKRHGGPKLALSFVAMRSNVHEMPQLLELAAMHNAVSVHVEPLYGQIGSSQLDEHYARENLGLLEPERVREAFATAQSMAAQSGIRFSSRFTAVRTEFDYLKAAAAIADRDQLCSEPWATIWVTSAGEVRTCCLNDVSFGTLSEQTFDDIWNGAAYRAFREQHVRREIAVGCGNCVRNGRTQSSPYFRVTDPATYRPMFDELPVAADDDPIVLDTPRAGATVTAPLFVSGRIRADVDPLDVVVMIDQTPSVNLNDVGLFQGSSFVAELPTHFVTEGAHVIWFRVGEASCAYREVHLWHPSSEHVTGSTTLVAPFTTVTPRLRVDGRWWDAERWRLMNGTRGPRFVAQPDFSRLAPGNHELLLTAKGRVIREMSVAK